MENYTNTRTSSNNHGCAGAGICGQPIRDSRNKGPKPEKEFVAIPQQEGLQSNAQAEQISQGGDPQSGNTLSSIASAGEVSAASTELGSENVEQIKVEGEQISQGGDPQTVTLLSDEQPSDEPEAILHDLQTGEVTVSEDTDSELDLAESSQEDAAQSGNFLSNAIFSIMKFIADSISSFFRLFWPEEEEQSDYDLSSS